MSNCVKSQVTLTAPLSGSVELDGPIHSEVTLSPYLAGSVNLDDPIHTQVTLATPPKLNISLCATNLPVDELFYRKSSPQGIRIAAPEEYRRPV